MEGRFERSAESQENLAIIQKKSAGEFARAIEVMRGQKVNLTCVWMRRGEAFAPRNEP